MAQLKWQNVGAPNLNGASQMLARANQAFSGSINSASGFLDQYSAGQQEMEDNALLGDIASISNEEELGAFLQSGALEGRNISPAMRQQVLGMRDDVLGYASSRANTDSTRASTAIRQAAEGRTAANYADGVASRDALRGVSGAASQAAKTGRQYGRGNTSDIQNQVYNGMLQRGIPEHVAQGFMMNFQDESGFEIDIEEGVPNVHGTRGKGIYQLTGARRDAFEAQYGNDYSIDNQLDFMVSELEGSEKGARDAIYATANAGDAGAAIVSKFLRPAEEHRARRSTAYTSGGQTFTPTQAVPKATDQIEAVRQQLVATGQFTPAEIEAQLAPLRAAEAQGQSRLDKTAADARLQEILMNPEVITGGAAQRAAINTPGMTPTQQLELAGRAGGLSEALPGIVAPRTTQNPVVTGAVTEALAANAAEVEALPQTRLEQELPKFEEDPVEGLISSLGAGNVDASERKNELRKQINALADKMGVPPSVAALALRETYEEDPSGFNTWGNVISSERAEAFISSNLSGEARTRYRGSKSARTLERAEIEAANLQLNQLKSQAAKYGAGNVPPAIQQQIQSLESTLTAQSTPGANTRQLQSYIQNSGAAGRLIGLEPGSAAHTRALKQIESDILGDPSLDQRDKDLLIAALKG